MSQIELPELDAVKSNVGGSRRVDVAGIRREQIVVAAVQIIVEQGLHSLSLSKIEEITGMKRGQLTYYFPTKEDILLAVFDRLLDQMLVEVHEGRNPRADVNCQMPPIWENVQRVLSKTLGMGGMREPLRTLQHTFLAQMPHRPDFRQKLADEYRGWRRGLGGNWKATGHPSSEVAKNADPQTIASFMMALVMGLGIQMAVDPEAFDRDAMLKFLLAYLSPLFTDMDPQSPGDTNHG